VLCGRGVVIFAELKVGKNTLRPEQRDWADALVNAGQLAFTWYPSDWSDIVALLENPTE
jgi:hypothetical protein